MVEAADVPAGTVRNEGLAAIVKSGWLEKTLTETVIE